MLLSKKQNKFEWYRNRISLMSPLEVGYRIKDEIRRKFAQRFLQNIKPKTCLTKNITNWYFDIQNKGFIFTFAKINNISNEQKAHELLEHKFSLFSFNKTFLGEVINWHRDYKNNKESPFKYCRDINYRDFDEVGDIKYIWEINRHQHLITLAKACYLTGDQKYKDEVRKQVLSWIEANPYKKGVNWESSLEVSIRLISWSWMWLFLKDIDEESTKVWLESIYRHCTYIVQNFSRYSSANNHLIGEAAGLFMATVVWPFGEESDRWQKKSFNILVEEIKKQNYEDGVNKEQAIAYQQFVLDFFILAGLLGEKNGIKFPEIHWQRVEKMLEFIASVMDKNGNTPNIGDSDDGYAVVLSDNEDFNPYQSLLATGAVLFKRGDFAKKAGQFDEKSFWLLGIEGWKKFNALDKKVSLPVKAFEKGGYYILGASENTEDEIKAVFDCGSLGYLSIAAHGHSDALSFTLNVGGQDFFVDPGTYAYHTQIEWRDYFRETSAHNTIRIDKKNQSVSGGNFMWLKKAEAKKEKWESTDRYDRIVANHNGYMRLNDPVLHTREICLDKKSKMFTIRDKIIAKKRHLIEQYFHLSQKCAAKDLGNNEWRITNGNRHIYLLVDKKFNANLIHGDENPILGWESKKFDVKNKTNVLANSCERHGECEFITTISMAKR